jgi:hypothetical protein
LDLVFDYKSETFYTQLNLRVSGPCRTYTEGPIIYTQGSVSCPGQKFKKAMKESTNVESFLVSVVRLKDMMKVWDEALTLQQKKEEEYGYNKLWD